MPHKSNRPNAIVNTLECNQRVSGRTSTRSSIIPHYSSKTAVCVFLQQSETVARQNACVSFPLNVASEFVLRALHKAPADTG